MRYVKNGIVVLCLVTPWVVLLPIGSTAGSKPQPVKSSKPIVQASNVDPSTSTLLAIAAAQPKKPRPKKGCPCGCSCGAACQCTSPGYCGDPSCTCGVKKKAKGRDNVPVHLPKEIKSNPCPCGCGCISCQCTWMGECGDPACTCGAKDKPGKSMTLHEGIAAAARHGKPLLLWVNMPYPGGDAAEDYVDCHSSDEWISSDVKEYDGYAGLVTESCVIVWRANDAGTLVRIGTIQCVPTCDQVKRLLAPRLVPISQPSYRPFFGGFRGGC